MKKRKAASSIAAAVAVAVIMGAASLGYGIYANVTTGSELSSINASLSSQGDHVGALQSTVSSQLQQIGTLQSTVGSMSASLSAQGQQIGILQASVGSLRSNLTSLQGKLAFVSGQLNTTQATVGSLRNNVTSLQNRLTLVTNQLNATEAADSAALLALSAEVRSLNATIQTLTTQLAALKAPALVQKSESTCSYVCPSGLANATFTTNVRGGDMLVITVVSDDLTNLIVSDSLRTRISLAVSATTSPSCISNTGTCQADIYWGLFPASGLDTVVVNEGSSPRALRVQAWEFSGVNSVESTVSCTPTCSSASYPSSGILIATAMDVTGAGPGFTWYPYAFSGVAGSEVQIIAGAGSTTFPFSTSVKDVEAGAVLVKTP